MITIAIPFYNAERYLPEAIESVINQTYKNWILLLVDDGSNDKSLSIANYYAEKDSRIKVYTDGENRNLGYRLNQIPNLVDTLYLARMDADDIMHPEKISKQMDVLLQNPDIDVLGTNAYTINDKDEIVGIRINPNQNEKLLVVDSFIHPTIIAKTEWFINNPYNVEAVRIEDTDLWMRTSKNNTFKCLVEPLFFYREFGNNYYQKYFKSIPSIWKITKNNNFKSRYFNLFLKTTVVSIIYFLFNLFGKEDYLILKRNSIILNKKSIKNYV